MGRDVSDADYVPGKAGGVFERPDLKKPYAFSRVSTAMITTRNW